MNVIPQYKVIIPYNYDRIIHNKKNYAKRQDIGQTSGNMHLILKIKMYVICYSERSQNSLKVKHLASYLYCSW